MGTEAQMRTGYAEDTGKETILRPYCPVSWFHPKGRVRVLQRLRPRLPNVEGSLFLTFTIDPNRFDYDHAKAHRTARQKLRKIFYALRTGVIYKGKTYKINSPYCIKVEFHAHGGAHYHVIFLTKRYIPNELIAQLWILGYTEVSRIRNEDFHYLLKYITKDNGQIPEWVKREKCLRIFQSSHGFLTNTEEIEEEPELRDDAPKERELLDTIGERIDRWDCKVVMRQTVTTVFGDFVKFSQFTLIKPFRELLMERIFEISLERCYCGNLKIIINNNQQLIEWLQWTQTAK